MSDFVIKIGSAPIARIIEARAILLGTTAGELIAKEGVDQCVIQATQEQIQLDHAAGTVGEDVKSLVDWSSLWQGVWREKSEGRIPESVVAAIEARAMAAMDAKHVAGGAA